MHAIAYICSNVVLKVLLNPVKYINISVYKVSNVQTVQVKVVSFADE